MISLIKNEVIKIFKKKSIYITSLVILAFVILTNCIYKFAYNSMMNTDYYEMQMKYMNEELQNLDPTKASDNSTYVQIKSDIDLYELRRNYDKGSWQYNIINEKLSSYIYELNSCKYAIEKNEQGLQEAQKRYDDMIERLNNGDWKHFAKEELDIAKEKLKDLENQKTNIVDKEELKQIDESINSAKLEVEVIQMRLDKDISYADGYQNDALNQYYNYTNNKNQLEKDKDKNYENKLQYNNYVEQAELGKYVIENNQDILKMDDNRGILMDLFSEYELFIIILIVMIAGGIVADEFSKGTIKLLLVRPHGRVKILCAKYITAIIMIIIAVLIVTIMQLVVGGIIFGFDSLKIPAVVYDFNAGGIIAMNVFTYLGINILAKLPLYIILVTIAFAFSSIFTNTALSITIGLLGYMSTSIINTLVIQFNIKFMKFFITPNWDFTQYLFGNLPQFEHINFNFSALMCVLYLVALLIPSFVVFNKRNIKNI